MSSSAARVAAFADGYRAYFNENAARSPDTLTMLDPMPRLTLVPGLGLFGHGRSVKEAKIAADIGVGPTVIDDVVVVFKAYPTRVGEGPFSTEMSHDESTALGLQEFGTVTHRERRIGAWDGEMARYSAMINGCTQAAITGIDKVDHACAGVTEFRRLSPRAKEFLRDAEADIGRPITLISTGPELSQIIDLRAEYCT